ANTFTPGALTYTNTGSTITFNSTSTQNIPGFAYFNNVNFNATTSNTLTAAITVGGNMSINTGFNDATFLVTGPGSGSGTLTLAAAKVYTATYIGSPAIPTFQTYSFDASSIVNFNGANTTTQTIPAAVYGAVNVTNGGTNVKAVSGN